MLYAIDRQESETTLTTGLAMPPDGRELTWLP